MNQSATLPKYKLSGFILACLSVLALGACSEPHQESKATESSSSSSQNSNLPLYLAATDASNAPYEMRDDKGLVVGFDIDIINAIAKKQGFRVKVLPQNWTGIFDRLNNNEVDIVVAPITINEERLKIVDFTIPYIKPTRTAFMLEGKDTALNVKNFSDIKNVQVAVKDKTTNLTSLQEMFGQDWKNYLPENTQYLAFKKMVAKQADVAFGDTIVLRFHAKSFPNTKFVQFAQPLETPVLAGFAVKKGNDKLAQKLNEGIQQIQADGTYNKILEKWFDPISVKEFSQ